VTGGVIAAADGVLEASRLGKRYGRVWALQECSLRLPSGCVAALVGPNGAGKSTLLHLAVGLTEPSAGEIRVLGRSDRHHPDVLARVGFVAQNTPLYATFTARELLRMGRALNRRWDPSLAVDRLRELAVPLDRPAGSLSGGQRAQVALALALGKKPDLLLLDEPVASLDPLARREFLQTLMAAVAETGMTVFLSSHLLADLERVCDHLVVLADGRVQVAGDVSGLLASHRLVRGPRRERDAATRAGWTVVEARHTERDSLLLVRTDDPVHDPALDVSQPSLEELVLAYLANPRVAALSGPAPAGRMSEVAR
jgi:ABC-type multidrug transport system ATPase subunit